MEDRMRVSDADREAVTARLRDHFAEGRLTHGELDERVSAALNAPVGCSGKAIQKPVASDPAATLSR